MDLFYIITCLVLLLHSVLSIELTFELPDNANQCFYEEMKDGIESTIEYQVVTGGQYDVDMLLEGPNGQQIYKEIRKQYDSHTFKVTQAGTYKACFSNEFSTFSHKIIYMDWQIGSEKPIVPHTGQQATAMTMIESSAQSIHEKLKIVDDYQTHHRLRESTGRKSAEELSERVLYWSLGQTVVILVLGIGQVMVLKSFFSDRRPMAGRL